jgi:hypothetical protein
MHDDGTSTMTASDLSAAEPPTSRQRTAILREVTRLVDELAPVRAPARPGAATPAVQCHRLPRGCVLQGATRAVSLSWFPAAGSQASLGELQLVTWKGTVSLPGSAARRSGATMVDERVFAPVEREGGVWHWQSEDTDLTTEALVARCRDLITPVVEA